MAVARWKGSIALGAFVQVPVTARAADKEEKLAFNLHHAGSCGGSIGQGVSICKACGADVDADEIVRGYKGQPGVDDEYLKSLEFEKSSVMELDRLVDASEIDPKQYQRSYIVTPDGGGAKAYVLLATLLEKHRKVGLGRIVMGGKEFIVTLRPSGGVLAMELMWWPTEVVADDSARLAIEGVDVSPEELAMGDQLVRFLSKPYEPEQYVNRLYQSKVEYLDRFLAGEEQPAVPKPVVAKPTDDLAAALAMSVKAMEAAATEKVAEAKKPARKRKAAA